MCALYVCIIYVCIECVHSIQQVMAKAVECQFTKQEAKAFKEELLQRTYLAVVYNVLHVFVKCVSVICLIIKFVC